MSTLLTDEMQAAILRRSIDHNRSPLGTIGAKVACAVNDVAREQHARDIAALRLIAEEYRSFGAQGDAARIAVEACIRELEGT